LKGITKGKLISVFGCAGERDPYKRPKMGKIASKLSDIVILTAEDPRTEDVNDIIQQIRFGMNKRFKNVFEIPDRKQAIEFALTSAKKGDLVALLGKGHEKSINLDGKNELPWSDQEVAKKLLLKY
jgi:UDP-N-acetylmuramoyl-L-alanyl-D-glutamate--2,6-diaminopimelate ligase